MRKSVNSRAQMDVKVANSLEHNRVSKTLGRWSW